jgi:hypothetical protein
MPIDSRSQLVNCSCHDSTANAPRALQNCIITVRVVVIIVVFVLVFLLRDFPQPLPITVSVNSEFNASNTKISIEIIGAKGARIPRTVHLHDKSLDSLQLLNSSSDPFFDCTIVTKNMELRDIGMFDDAFWKLWVRFVAKVVAAATGLISDWLIHTASRTYSILRLNMFLIAFLSNLPHLHIVFSFNT